MEIWIRIYWIGFKKRIGVRMKDKTKDDFDTIVEYTSYLKGYNDGLKYAGELI